MDIENDQFENESDVERFGRLVREARKTEGWSQEALAAEAFSNSTRKGYVSEIENGKISNITRENVRSVARALKIDVEDIPLSLRWPEAVEKAGQTNEIVQEIRDDVKSLIAVGQAKTSQDEFTAISIETMCDRLAIIERGIPFEQVVLGGKSAIAPDMRKRLATRDTLIERLEAALSEHSEPWRYAGHLSKLMTAQHWSNGPEFFLKLDLRKAAELIIDALPDDPPEEVVILCIKLGEVLRANALQIEATRRFAQAAPWIEKIKSDAGRELSLYYAEDFMVPGGPGPDHFADQVTGSKEAKMLSKAMLLRCYACRVLRRNDPQAAYALLDEAESIMGTVTSQSFQARYNRLYATTIRIMLDWYQGEIDDETAYSSSKELVAKVEASIGEERPLIAVLKFVQLRVLSRRTGAQEPEDKKWERLRLARAIHTHLQLSTPFFCVENLDLARDLARMTITELEGNPPSSI